jgi:hypothetical protein
VVAILGTLVLLFGAFVLVQIRYLFGGHALVERLAGLTYSEYARRGFFELVVAAALLLPVIMAVDWSRRRERGSRAFAIPAACLVALLAVVIASAAQRLNVYQDAYGLTELRLYALSSLGLVAAACAWFSATVLRGQPRPFIAGCLALALTTVVVLDVANAEAAISKVNIERAAEGKRFDADYLLRLGPDAVPAIIARLSRIPESDRCFVAVNLWDRWSDGISDWRRWSLSESRARASVHRHREDLALACR